MTAPTSRSAVISRQVSPGLLQRSVGFWSDYPGHDAIRLVLIGWAPLIVLALLQSIYLQADHISSLLREVGVHVRYLVAVPLLAVAGGLCGPELNRLIRHLVRSRIAAEADALEQAIASTEELSTRPAAAGVIVALVYLAVSAAVHSYTASDLPPWAASGGITPIFSPAGWWHTLVSLPLLLFLIFAWIWRLSLWTRLLWLVSRLKLRIVASHPDHCGGLGFLGHSVRAFAIVALALSSIVAARSAHLVLAGDLLPTPHLWFNVGLIASLIALFAAPLLIFTPLLVRVWRQRSLDYGALAGQIGSALEDKWLTERKLDHDALSQPDFSATADFYAVAANVQSMRFIPVGLTDLLVLAAATLVPFVPVLLISVPVSQILSGLRSLLL